MYLLKLRYNKKLFQLVYQHKISNSGFFILQRLKKYNKKDEKKAKLYRVFRFLLLNEKEIDKAIKENFFKSSEEFQLLSLVDLIILEIGFCYFLIDYYLPPKVIINEMIRLAKSYSDVNSYKFINKLLDRAIRGDKNA